MDSELTDDLRKIIQTVSKGSDAKTNRFLLSDDQRIKEESFLKKGGRTLSLYEPQSQPEEPEVERTRRGRIGEAIRRQEMEQQIEEERSEEREYEDRENQDEQIMEQPVNQPGNPLDRMMWSSTKSTSTDN